MEAGKCKNARRANTVQGAARIVDVQGVGMGIVYLCDKNVFTDYSDMVVPTPDDLAAIDR